MRELELSSRLVSALDSAGALDASIEDFCGRFSFQVLKKCRGINRNTCEDLAYALIELERGLREDLAVRGRTGSMRLAHKVHIYRRALQEESGLVA